VLTVRCSRKLLVRPGSTPVLDDIEPTMRLGDWYANHFFRPERAAAGA
jgi:hypothetical protein